VCVLRPLTSEIVVQASEIAEATWMPVCSQTNETESTSEVTVRVLTRLPGLAGTGISLAH